MKKNIALFLAFAMVLSLFSGVLNVKATVDKAPDPVVLGTGVPTYELVESGSNLITGLTSSPLTTNVVLSTANSGTQSIISLTPDILVPQTNVPYVLNYSLVSKEGTYNVSELTKYPGVSVTNGSASIVFPGSVANISAGMSLFIDDGGLNINWYTVVSVDPATYTVVLSGAVVLPTSTRNVYVLRNTSPVYIKFKATVNTSVVPTIGLTNVLVYGNLTAGTSAVTASLDGLSMTMGISTDNGASWAPVAVSPNVTTDGAFSFYVSFSNYGLYGLFVSDGYAPDGIWTPINMSNIYKTWVVSAGPLTVTPVFTPSNVYATTASETYLYVSDSNGKGVAGVSITLSAGIPWAGMMVTDISAAVDPDLAGFYKITGTPVTMGVSVFKAQTSTQSGTVSMNILPVTGDMIRPYIAAWPLTGFKPYGATISFRVDFTPAAPSIIHDSTVVSNGLAFDSITAGPGYLSQSFNIVLSKTGKIAFDAEMLKWDNSAVTALTATAVESGCSFVVAPEIVGYDVAVATDKTSYNVGDVASVTVTMKAPAPVQYINNGKIEVHGPIGCFGNIPSGVLWAKTYSGTEEILTLDASTTGPGNVNIVNGTYVISGIKLLMLGYASVYVYDGASPSNVIGIFPLAINVVRIDKTLVSSVPKFTAGRFYGSVVLSGAVAGIPSINWSGATPSMDNGDGTYTFNFPAGISDVENITITAWKDNYTYSITIPVVKPEIELVSVHKDGKITDSLEETVEFKIKDPQNGEYLTPSSFVILSSYTLWNLSSRSNYQKVDYTITSLAAGLSNKITLKATLGNPNVDYTKEDATFGFSAVLNGTTVELSRTTIAVKPAVITITPSDLVLYYGIENTFSANLKDAHSVALPGISVYGSNPFQQIGTYVFGGETGADGTVLFKYTPNYIGQVELTSDITGSLKIQIVPAPADTTPPVISVVGLTSGQTVNKTNVTVNGTISEAVSTLLVNGAPVTVLPDNSFSANVVLANGENHISFVTFDLHANKGTLDFVLNYTAPVDNSIKVAVTIGNDIATVTKDGKTFGVTFDASAEIVNGRTMVPLRFIAETFGGEVEWFAETRMINITLGDKVIALQIGNKNAIFNDALSVLDVAPYIKNSRTMVPLRAIGELFGATFVWDNASRTVTFTFVP